MILFAAVPMGLAGQAQELAASTVAQVFKQFGASQCYAEPKAEDVVLAAAAKFGFANAEAYGAKVVDAKITASEQHDLECAFDAKVEDEDITKLHELEGAFDAKVEDEEITNAKPHELESAVDAKVEDLEITNAMQYELDVAFGAKVEDGGPELFSIETPRSTTESAGSDSARRRRPHRRKPTRRSQAYAHARALSAQPCVVSPAAAPGRSSRTGAMADQLIEKQVGGQQGKAMRSMRQNSMEAKLQDKLNNGVADDYGRTAPPEFVGLMAREMKDADIEEVLIETSTVHDRGGDDLSSAAAQLRHAMTNPGVEFMNEDVAFAAYAAHAGDAALIEEIITVLSGCVRAEGLTIEEVASAMSERPLPGRMRDALAFLVSEGEIFTTISPQHFSV